MDLVPLLLRLLDQQMGFQHAAAGPGPSILALDVIQFFFLSCGVSTQYWLNCVWKYWYRLSFKQDWSVGLDILFLSKMYKLFHLSLTKPTCSLVVRLTGESVTSRLSLRWPSSPASWTTTWWNCFGKILLFINSIFMLFYADFPTNKPWNYGIKFSSLVLVR